MERNPELVEIKGKQVIMLVPELVENMAIVDLAVIKRLAALLPSVTLYETRNQLERRLDKVHNLEEYVNELAAEVSFHRSVNMITEYMPESEKTTDHAVYAIAKNH